MYRVVSIQNKSSAGIKSFYSYVYVPYLDSFDSFRKDFKFIIVDEDNSRKEVNFDLLMKLFNADKVIGLFESPMSEINNNLGISIYRITDDAWFLAQHMDYLYTKYDVQDGRGSEFNSLLLGDIWEWRYDHKSLMINAPEEANLDNNRLGSIVNDEMKITSPVTVFELLIYKIFRPYYVFVADDTVQFKGLENDVYYKVDEEALSFIAKLTMIGR